MLVWNIYSFFPLLLWAGRKLCLNNHCKLWSGLLLNWRRWQQIHCRTLKTLAKFTHVWQFFPSRKWLYNCKCLLVCPSVRPSVRLSGSKTPFHPSSFIFHPSSFILHHSSFILQLLSFSACFICWCPLTGIFVCRDKITGRIRKIGKKFLKISLFNRILT